MFKLFKIILIVCGFFLPVCYGQVIDNFEISIPDYIPEGKPFEISLITSKEFDEADHLEIYIIPQNKLIVNNAELRAGARTLTLGVTQEYLKEFSTSSLKININLKDSLLATQGTYFQVLVDFSPADLSQTNFKLYGTFKKDKEIIGYLESTINKLQTDDQYLYNIDLYFYETFDLASKTAKFNPYSHLNIPLDKKGHKKLLVEFWMKQVEFEGELLKIINKQTSLPEYKLFINENRMLVSSSDVNKQFVLKPIFISENAWYHISILFSLEESVVYFYCNDEELSKIEYPQYISLKDLSLQYSNESWTTGFCIDQIRIINLTGSFRSVSRNKNFINYGGDSSTVLLQIDFTNSQLDNMAANTLLSYDNVIQVESDAPIFPRAPELNLKVMNKYYELEWSGGDYSNAVYYILERAVGTEGFTELAKWEAERKTKKVYSQLSEKIEQDVVYFRLKQINLDGTEIYSDVVKVGQGELENLLVDQNYPNPFNPNTYIEFELLQDNEVEVTVFDLAGKEVAALHKGFLTQGIYKFEFDGSELPSGVYLYRVSTPQFTRTRKMILAK